jgi:tRNA pseudouridine38-40 synthase
MHIKMTVEYVGTKFHGFQAQAGKRTVQGELQKAISKYFGREVKVVGSGRTDAGVHAFGQVVSFLLPVEVESGGEGKFLYRLCSGVNNFLPADISVKNPEIMAKFNARSDAKSKTYIYKCFVGENRSAARDEFYHQIYKMPDIGKLRQAAEYFVGVHDFTAFCGEKNDRNPTRTIYECRVELHGDEMWFTVRGNGFLKNMVRIMVGTLLSVAENKFAPADIEKMLLSHDRHLAGSTAPAKGLTLHSVEY